MRLQMFKATASMAAIKVMEMQMEHLSIQDSNQEQFLQRK